MEWQGIHLTKDGGGTLTTRLHKEAASTRRAGKMKGSGEPEGGLRNSMLTMEVPVPQHDKMIVKIVLFRTAHE